jgi:nucleotide-binding universal stress UspA family protein
MTRLAVVHPSIEEAVESSPLPQHLAVGVDGTPSSMRALAFAATVARRNESRVTVVFVRHAPPIGMLGGAAAGWPAIFDQVESEVRAAARHTLRGVRWDLVVADGSPAQELERVATEVGADLLIVGSTAGGWFHRLLEGSVGARVASDAPLPVLVVR